jgi:anti-sigma B factor antagonist
MKVSSFILCCPSLDGRDRSLPEEKESIMDMDIVSRLVDNISVVEVKGFIDGKTAPAFQEKVLQTIEEAKTLLIDLREVDFLSSAGLRALLVTHRTTQEKSVAVALSGLSEMIRDNMEATGFLTFFRVFDSLESGLEELK